MVPCLEKRACDIGAHNKIIPKFVLQPTCSTVLLTELNIRSPKDIPIAEISSAEILALTIKSSTVMP